MYFYTNKIPNQNDLVVCDMVKETESSIYISLPEYDNIQGIITKSQLPKKRKQYHKTIKHIRSTKTFAGIISDNVEFDDDGNTLLINISYISDKELNEKYMNYYKRYLRLIKVLLFLSKETDSDYYDLLKKLKIIPIQVDEEIIDHYGDFIKNPEKYISNIGIDYDISKYITHPKIADVKFELQLSIGSIDNSKLTKDPVFVLKDIFNIITKSYDVKITVIGCPNYQVIFNKIDVDDVISTIKTIENIIQNYIDENEIKSYVFNINNIPDTLFDKSESIITFPYKIEF